MKFKAMLRAILLCLALVLLLCSCEDTGGYIEDPDNKEEDKDPGNEGGDESGDTDDKTQEVEYDDTIYISSVKELLDYKNENGQKVVMDLSVLTDTTVGKTVTISGDVSQITFHGSNDTVYKDLNIVIDSHDTLPITIIFADFKMVGNSKDGAIYCPSGREITVISGVGENIVSGGDGASALNAPNSLVKFDGLFHLKLIGGKGEDGINAAGTNGITGGNGGEGAVAVTAARIEKRGAGSVRIVGGTGGNGGCGSQGKSGGDGYDGIGEIWFTVTKPLKNAGAGESGGKGGDGGVGGRGGLPLNTECALDVINGDLELKVGVGGNGGNGGTGGTGGNGGNGGDANKGGWLGLGWSYGVNGGVGGTGGIGGTGGKGGASDATGLEYNATVQEKGRFTVTSSENGNGGNGGTGGNGGNGGIGGSCDDAVLGNDCRIGSQKCTCGGKGGNGGVGGDGGKGGDGSVGGKGGECGSGGIGGKHSVEKINCDCVGKSSEGGFGKNGADGAVIMLEGSHPDDTTDTSKSVYPGYGLDFPAGTATIALSDGTRLYILPDETSVYVMSNGKILTKYTDGSWKYLNPDGSPMQNDDNWPQNEFTALVPKPDFEMALNRSEALFSVSFTNINLRQMKSYAEMLKLVGFDARLNENTLGELYQFSAYNTDGYKVSLLYNNGFGHLMMYK